MDIEFAYKDQKVYILQARRLTAVDNQQKYIQNKAKKELIEAIENKYSKKFL
jgi:phosphoenolpyruvate synthase/pyruvate phosphate dikinase